MQAFVAVPMYAHDKGGTDSRGFKKDFLEPLMPVGL